MADGGIRIDVAGAWRGTYTYADAAGIPNPGPVDFVLALKPGVFNWLTGSFAGTVEDVAGGMPGTGRVHGAIRRARIHFVKMMPVCYVRQGVEPSASLQEVMAKHGYKVTGDLAHPPIVYDGAFDDVDHAKGMWRLPSRLIRISFGRAFRTLESRGSWTLSRDTG